MKKMKRCKSCGGRGFIFAKSSYIDTGKEMSYFGLKMPIYTSGNVQETCGKCFGKGVR